MPFTYGQMQEMKKVCEQHGVACGDVPRPWWVWKTTEWSGRGMTTVAPFWRPVHIWNALTQLRGWYLVKRGY